MSRRVPLDSAYPLSLVNIVDDMENVTGKPEPLCANPELAGGLDTTDSGYSQDNYKEGSPLTSEIVNTDEEEAAVLEHIFFLPGRVWRAYLIDFQHKRGHYIQIEATVQ